MRELTTEKWISDLKFFDHLPLLKVFRIENGTSGPHGRRDDQGTGAESDKVEYGSSRPTLVEAAEFSDQNELHLVATRQPDAAVGNELILNAKKDIADSFLCLAAQPTFALDRLSRYEHLLWRQARQIVFTLESLRRRKRAPSRSTFPFSFRQREPSASSE
jgi:hypothetical protein